MSEFILRRHMAENPAHFDRIRKEWRRGMYRLAIKRDASGRFAR